VRKAGIPLGFAQQSNGLLGEFFQELTIR